MKRGNRETQNPSVSSLRPTSHSFRHPSIEPSTAGKETQAIHMSSRLKQSVTKDSPTDVPPFQDAQPQGNSLTDIEFHLSIHPSRKSLAGWEDYSLSSVTQRQRQQCGDRPENVMHVETDHVFSSQAGIIPTNTTSRTPSPHRSHTPITPTPSPKTPPPTSPPPS